MSAVKHTCYIKNTKMRSICCRNLCLFILSFLMLCRLNDANISGNSESNSSSSRHSGNNNISNNYFSRNSLTNPNTKYQNRNVSEVTSRQESPQHHIRHHHSNHYRNDFNNHRHYKHHFQPKNHSLYAVQQRVQDLKPLLGYDNRNNDNHQSYDSASSFKRLPVNQRQSHSPKQHIYGEVATATAPSAAVATSVFDPMQSLVKHRQIVEHHQRHVTSSTQGPFTRHRQRHKNINRLTTTKKPIPYYNSSLSSSLKASKGMQAPAVNYNDHFKLLFGREMGGLNIIPRRSFVPTVSPTIKRIITPLTTNAITTTTSTTTTKTPTAAPATNLQNTEKTLFDENETNLSDSDYIAYVSIRDGDDDDDKYNLDYTRPKMKPMLHHSSAFSRQQIHSNDLLQNDDPLKKSSAPKLSNNDAIMPTTTSAMVKPSNQNIRQHTDDNASDDNYDYNAENLNQQNSNIESSESTARKNVKKRNEQSSQRKDLMNDEQSFAEPGDRTREKNAKLSTQQGVNRERAKMGLAAQHADQVFDEVGLCEPKPRIFNFLKKSTKKYTPHRIVLHQCSDETSCCREIDETCVRVSFEYVTLHFMVTHMDNIGSGETDYEAMTFENATECECQKINSLNGTPIWHIPTAIPQRTSICQCPKYFAQDLAAIPSCKCDCTSSTDDACQKLKNGAEHFSIAERTCINKGSCEKPTCNHGYYDSRNGKCPRK